MGGFKICAVLLVLAVATASMSPVVNSFEEYIFNLLGGNAKLTVHCKSQDEDLGTVVVDDGNHFNWKFHLKSNSTTFYVCDMSFENVKGQFRIFDEVRDVMRCDTLRCIWEVQRDGLYLYIRENVDYEKQFSWP
ncbi:hypothetical protein ACOSP7_006536 [Xanthoceras sorbifolium]